MTLDHETLSFLFELDAVKAVEAQLVFLHYQRNV